MVLLWTALKDKYEDNRRKRDDDKENMQQTYTFDISTRRLVSVAWQDIKVGDLVMVSSDGTFPADLLLLHTKECAEAFMSTVMLDGETSLKERTVHKTFEKYAHQLMQRQAPAVEPLEAAPMTQKKLLELGGSRTTSSSGKRGCTLHDWRPRGRVRGANGCA
jgi:P-type E1-E2 ATPase